MNPVQRKRAALLSLCLSALLGTAQAQAQTLQLQAQLLSIPATPAPAAQPALPDVATNTAPLRLHAAPGTTLEYATTRQVQVTAFSLKVVARPGAVLSAADRARVADLNTALSGQMPALQHLISRAQPAVAGKQFLKVQPTDAQGNMVLLSTWVAAPLSLGSAAPAPRTVRLTQSVAPDGTTLDAQIAADDPAAQRFYDALPSDQRLNSFGQNAQAGLYGLNLVSGGTGNLVQALDLSGLLGDLAAALGGAAVADQIRAQPLLLDVGTTFLGRSKAGVLSYQQRFAARPWTLSAQGAGAQTSTSQTSTLRLTVTDWSGQGGLSFRPDGLPQTSDSAQSAGLDLVLDVPGVPAQLQAHLEFTLTASSAAR
ncbi:hypothetical protein GCM10022631_35490 [Deinococcus rubellus]|uniref:Uncharacterized protein n=1 Tax=Deinococcus rubellus TaxID=1889240 RepID=A0ABY5YHQ5_9DEIO|nr:hypothetical protein [Deinococcus rubellus]UWX64622.1 hypothetical protein N0D28_02865 [Deinococcus rubellus]